MGNATNQRSDDLLGQRQLRLEKLKKLEALGIESYPANAKKDYSNTYIREKFSLLEGKKVTIAGRLMSFREHGKLIFADLVDESGKLQLFIKQDAVYSHKKEELSFENLQLLDVGDFVQATGTVVKTTRGEISLDVSTVQLLTKSIRPLPQILDDKEQQFRRRYLDLAIHPEKRELFKRKARFWQTSREFMQKQGFIEIETPVLEHVTGGADARPFVTHHNDLDQDFYLRISTELYQKRLIGAGFEKIYTLAPNFRNEGTSDEHLQEYYQLEWYWAYANYEDNMELVKNLFRYIAKGVWGTSTFTSHGHTFNLEDEWKKIDYVEVIKDKFDIDIFKATEKEMLTVLKKEKISLSGTVNKNRLIDNLWKCIRKEVSGPAFLVNEPKFMSPLAKSKPEDGRLTERFHVILAGSELANGYSELNNPQDQLERFLEQQGARDKGDDEAQMLDIDYVEMLEYGMPPCSGVGVSERLFWFIENITAREGTLFPQLKNEVEELTKKLYPKIYS